MTRTFTITLANRHNDVERIIGLFSATGYKIDKMILTKQPDSDLSRLIVVTDCTGKNVDNFVLRLRQQVRVELVESTGHDLLIRAGEYRIL